MKIKNYFSRWVTRISVVWTILFKEEHWIFISLTRDQMYNLFQEQDMTIDFAYMGHQRYTALKVIKAAAEGVDDTEMILLKAEFEAKAEHPELRAESKGTD